jgi:hypothetical protein
MSFQNGRGTIASVQKATRATDRKRKIEDALCQATRDSDSSGDGNINGKDETPVLIPTKSKGKGKAKTRADNTRKSLRKRAKKT